LWTSLLAFAHACLQLLSSQGRLDPAVPLTNVGQHALISRQWHK
jgi:hypothetical protein